MNDFSKNILNTIQSKHIAPRPHWVFVARQVVLFAGFLLSILIGGISVSIILLALSDVDLGAGQMMRMHPGPFLITYLPYVWVLAMVVFGSIAYYDARNIKGAYRHRTIVILGVSILASVIIGGLLHAAGAGKIAERRFAQIVPQYRGLDSRKMHLWMRPQEGMLAGKIVSGSATSTFVLEDFSGAQWIIEASGATLRGPIAGVSGERIRVAGSVIQPAVFRATDVFPWTRGGSMMQDGMMPQGDMNGFEQRGMMFPWQAQEGMRERNMLRVP